MLHREVLFLGSLPVANRLGGAAGLETLKVCYDLPSLLVGQVRKGRHASVD